MIYLLRWYPSVAEVELVNAIRASGAATCVCGRAYIDHPLERRAAYLGYEGAAHLTRLCTGLLVHL